MSADSCNRGCTSCCVNTNCDSSNNGAGGDIESLLDLTACVFSPPENCKIRITLWMKMHRRLKGMLFFFLFLKRTVQSLEADPFFKQQINGEDVPLVQFMHLAFTCMPGESYCRRLNVSWLLDEQVMRRVK